MKQLERGRELRLALAIYLICGLMMVATVAAVDIAMILRDGVVVEYSELGGPSDE